MRYDAAAGLPTATSMMMRPPVAGETPRSATGTIRRPGGDCLSRFGGGCRRCLAATAMTCTPAVSVLIVSIEI